MKLKVTVNGIPYDIEVEVEEEEKVAPTIVIGGAGGMQTPVAATASVRATSANAVVAPLSGSVSKILVEEGQRDQGRRGPRRPRGHEDGDRDHGAAPAPSRATSGRDPSRGGPIEDKSNPPSTSAARFSRAPLRSFQ